jgi:type IV secretory pathway TrbF-like protein
MLKKLAGLFNTRRQNDLPESIKDNPYLQSRMLWNDVYGQAEKHLHFSLGLNAVLVLGLMASIAGMITLSHQRSIKPYPFIIHGEHVLTSTEESQAAVEHLKPQLANVLAKGFIRNMRRVSTDQHVNRERQMAALAVTSHQALAVTQHYFQDNNANNTAKSKINDVKITSVLQSSEQTLVVRWQELWREPKTGEVLATEQYVAEMTYQFDTPSTHELVLKYNPLGFYVQRLSWSLEKMGV